MYLGKGSGLKLDQELPHYFGHPHQQQQQQQKQQQPINITPSIPTMPSPSRKESEAQVRSWGFSHVFTWTDGPYAFSTRLLHSPSPLNRLTTFLSPSFPFARRNLELTGRTGRRNRNAHYAPHSHDGLTTHLIRRGSLTITYPRDEKPSRETFGVGCRLDVGAGRVHEVWMGDEGCEYVIGE